MSRTLSNEVEDEERSDDKTEYQIKKRRIERLEAEMREQEPDARLRRELESLLLVLERRNIPAFGAQILRKAVQMDIPGSDNIVELLLQYKTHAIDTHTIGLAASNTAYGGDFVRMFRHHDKSLVIDDGLSFNNRSMSLRSSLTTDKRPSSLTPSPTINNGDHSRMTWSVDKATEEYAPNWDPQACSTRSPNTNFII